MTSMATGCFRALNRLTMQLLAEQLVQPAEWLSARASPTAGYTLLCGARLPRAVAAGDSMSSMSCLLSAPGSLAHMRIALWRRSTLA